VGRHAGDIDPALIYCNTVWVPHPRDAFVFVARVGGHDANLLDRINKSMDLQGHEKQFFSFLYFRFCFLRNAGRKVAFSSKKVTLCDAGMSALHRNALIWSEAAKLLAMRSTDWARSFGLPSNRFWGEPRQ
jgi:hypothetical protein